MTSIVLVSIAAVLVATAPAAAQMATAERVEAERWWPTKAVPREGFIGSRQCAACHPKQAATQPMTSMARTGYRASASTVLRDAPALTFRAGGYDYSIERRGEERVFTVKQGDASRAAPLAWAFGAGKVGQSFLFERNGQLHEARVSYYEAIRALDFTPNRALDAPRDIDEAMSRAVPDAEVRRCFACHTTASAKPAGGVDVGSLIEGVTCEACHGPGRAHVRAVAQGRREEGRQAIFNPKALGPADSIDFCGACHATFWDVKLANESGIAALRSQPHRLQSSKCWSMEEARISCVACHDPHQPLVRESASYDARCLSCHVPKGATPTESHPVRACKVETAKCAGCHMPKYEVPGMHFSFTDHLIRVVRGEGP